LVPVAEVSAINVVLPKHCGHCGGNLPQKPNQVTTEGGVWLSCWTNRHESAKTDCQSVT
jgi:hypothetical protein